MLWGFWRTQEPQTAAAVAVGLHFCRPLFFSGQLKWQPPAWSSTLDLCWRFTETAVDRYFTESDAQGWGRADEAGGEGEAAGAGARGEKNCCPCHKISSLRCKNIGTVIMHNQGELLLQKMNYNTWDRRGKKKEKKNSTKPSVGRWRMKLVPVLSIMAWPAWGLMKLRLIKRRMCLFVVRQGQECSEDAGQTEVSHLAWALCHRSSQYHTG